MRSRAPAPARRGCTVLLHKVSEPSAAHLVHLATLVPIILVVIAAEAHYLAETFVYRAIGLISKGCVFNNHNGLTARRYACHWPNGIEVMVRLEVECTFARHSFRHFQI